MVVSSPKKYPSYFCRSSGDITQAEVDAIDAPEGACDRPLDKSGGMRLLELGSRETAAEGRSANESIRHNVSAYSNKMEMTIRRIDSRRQGGGHLWR